MTLDNPAAVLARLSDIENDLAVRQGAYEAAALAYFKAKRDREHDRAVAFISAVGTVAERSAIADRETALNAAQEEALYESIKAVMRTLEVRASIGQSILRSQGRA